jgi:hypothetical protein
MRSWRGSPVKILLPIHPEFTTNKYWIDLITYLHGSMADLAWLVLNCWDDEEAYMLMVEQQLDDLADFLLDNSDGLASYDSNKMLAAVNNPTYRLGLVTFFDAHKQWYYHLLGPHIARSPSRLESNRKDCLLISYD